MIKGKYPVLRYSNQGGASHELDFYLTKEQLEIAGIKSGEFVDVGVRDGEIFITLAPVPEEIIKEKEENEAQCRPPVPENPNINDWKIVKDYRQNLYKKCYLQIIKMDNPEAFIRDMRIHLSIVYKGGIIVVHMNSTNSGFNGHLFTIKLHRGVLRFEASGCASSKLKKGRISRKDLTDYLISQKDVKLKY